MNDQTPPEGNTPPQPPPFTPLLVGGVKFLLMKGVLQRYTPIVMGVGAAVYTASAIYSLTRSEENILTEAEKYTARAKRKAAKAQVLNTAKHLKRKATATLVAGGSKAKGTASTVGSTIQDAALTFVSFIPVNLLDMEDSKSAKSENHGSSSSSSSSYDSGSNSSGD